MQQPSRVASSAMQSARSPGGSATKTSCRAIACRPRRSFRKSSTSRALSCAKRSVRLRRCASSISTTGKRATVAQIDHGAMGLMIEHGVHTAQITIHQIYDVRRTIETRVATLAPAIRRTETEARSLIDIAAAMPG